MGWALWCLAHNPQCQEKIFEELDNVFGDSDRDITMDDLKNVKYLERCIKEGLRLRPSVPNFTRIVEEDIDIGKNISFRCLIISDGTFVPRGCTIVICPMVIHMNESVWGENCEVYNPDNFSDENSSKRHPYAYIPFSAGPRNCIGQKFALMEEKTVLAWFFRRYKLTPSMEFLDNLPLPEVILRPACGFPVKIEKRYP